MLLKLLISLSWASSSDWRPRYLSGLSLLGAYDDTILVDKYKVKYDYLYENNILNLPYKKEKLDFLINESYRFSVDKIHKLGINPVDCKTDLNVHLVHLEGSTINNDDRFGSWRTINGGNLTTIYGLYDPTIDVYRNSVISFMILPQGSDSLIIHEMAHYWYDRFCIYDENDIKTETFAKSVENAYIKSLLDWEEK